MRFVDSHTLNKYVFSLFLNVSIIDMSGVRSSAERLFHTRGPWTMDINIITMLLV